MFFKIPKKHYKTGEKQAKKILDQVLTQPWTKFWRKKPQILDQVSSMDINQGSELKTVLPMLPPLLWRVFTIAASAVNKWFAAITCALLWHVACSFDCRQCALVGNYQQGAESIDRSSFCETQEVGRLANGFRGSNASGGRIVLLPCACWAQGETTQWPLWAHPFYWVSVCYSVSELRKACFCQARVAQAVLPQSAVFHAGASAHPPCDPKSHIGTLPHLGFSDVSNPMTCTTAASPS